MPLYEYACDACGQRFELIRKFSDPPLETCYRCGRGPVRKLLSSPAFQFKGTGWYVTDYARKGQSAPSDDTSKSGDTSKKTSDAKTDTTSGTTKTDKPSSSD